MPYLPDMLYGWEEAAEEMSRVVVRFELDTPDGRRKLADLFSRFDQALRLTPRPDGIGTHDILLDEENNLMHELCVFLLRTGCLRDRAERADLAVSLLSMAEMLHSRELPDELWDRYLDDRTVHPSERLRRLFVLHSVGDPA